MKTNLELIRVTGISVFIKSMNIYYNSYEMH
jgi:hypothetical protein